MLVINAASADATGVVECEGELFFAEHVPAVGAAILDRATPSSVTPVGVEDDMLYNGLVEARIDALGRVSMLRDIGSGRDAWCRLPSKHDRPVIVL